MNCDRIGPWYAALEHIGFGGELQRRRCTFLSRVSDARRILVLGEGDGRFLVRLMRESRGAAIDYADLSGRMLQLARRRCGDGINYHCGDARTMPLPRSEYDLIVTHFFLDCFDESDAAAVVARLSEAARPRARWLISEFREPSAWARALVRMLYLFFRVTTRLKTRRLVDHHPLLERHGFHLARSERARGGLLASELWERR